MENQGDLSAALDRLEQALGIYRRLPGNPARLGTITILETLSAMLNRLGDTDKADAYAREATKLRRQLEEPE